MSKNQNWYTNPRNNSIQGLIIDENTGANIAVSYDPADAPLIAAAPALVSSIERLLNCPDLNLDSLEEESRMAINQARGTLALANGQGEILTAD